MASRKEPQTVFAGVEVLASINLSGRRPSSRPRSDGKAGQSCPRGHPVLVVGPFEICPG